MDEKLAILGSAYLGPIQYYSKFFLYDRIIIECHENYTKQSYRNRCTLLGANGPVNLTIPVKHTGKEKIQLKDARIDYEKDWQKLHWRTIYSAYNSSPFFDHFRDDLSIFYQKKPAFLMDMTIGLHEYIMDQLDLRTSWALSKQFVTMVSYADYRNTIHPKKNFISDPEFRPVPYIQVFPGNRGFHPNLSILDLLCCEGPGAYELIKKATRFR